MITRTLNHIQDFFHNRDHIKGALLIIQAWGLSTIGGTMEQVSYQAELWKPILADLSYFFAIISTIYGVYKLSKKKK